MSNHTESKPIQPEASSGTQKAKSRLRTYKRKQRRLKATISLLKEDLANSRDLADELNNKWLDERQRVKALLAEKRDFTCDAIKVVYETEHKVYEAGQIVNDAFLALSQLTTALAKHNLAAVMPQGVTATTV